MITYKWIDGDELLALEPIMEKRGWTSLNNRTARAFCAYDGDKLVGFHVLQMFPHCEPLYVDPAYRGSGIADHLAEGMLTFMREVSARGFMVIADSPAAEALCRHYGMRKVDSPVYLM